MRPNTVFLIGAVLALAFGLGFLLVPAALLPMYGVSTEAPVLLMSRFFGVALVHLGLLVYLLREVRDPGSQRAIALAGVIGSVAGTAVALRGVLQHVVNGLGWSTVAIYALLVLGYASCLRGRTAVA